MAGGESFVFLQKGFDWNEFLSGDLSKIKEHPDGLQGIRPC